jgi:putative cell wall-binding protein
MALSRVQRGLPGQIAREGESSMSRTWRGSSAHRITAAAIAVIVAGGLMMAAAPTASAGAPTAKASVATTAALSGSSFQPGNIISDYAFFNRNAMTQSDIQTFLNAQCPTNDCINVLKSATAAETTNVECPGGYTAEASETTAAILYKIEQLCGISAKVLLVTLQKEQGLVTAQHPSTGALRAAMGYECPDSAPCSTSAAGFFRQIYDAAWQFQEYRINQPSSTTKPLLGVTSSILYHPAPSSCGTESVKVADEATRGLYIYTPYAPNAAALANLHGIGNSCSSYGNRNFWVYYNEWFGSPTTTVPPGVTVSRIGGADRYDVAVGLSQANFNAGVPVVYIASGANFPDALSAGPSAAKQGGPLLLVQPTAVPPEVAAELTRLKPQSIVVVGGPASVTPAVYTQLSAYAPVISRITGANRYVVSQALAQSVFAAGVTKVFVATGRTFPDALSASAAAGTESVPVILIDGLAKTLDPNLVATLTALGVKQIDIAGGPASVLPAVQTELAAIPGVTGITRYTGADRYAVSGALNRAEFGTASGVYVATGVTFPDALAGAAVAGAQHDPLYIVKTSCIPSYILDDFLTLKPTTMTILGGTGSLTSSIQEFRGC